ATTAEQKSQETRLQVPNQNCGRTIPLQAAPGSGLRVPWKIRFQYDRGKRGFTHAALQQVSSTSRRSCEVRLCHNEVLQNQIIHFTALKRRQCVFRRTDDRLLDVEGRVEQHRNARKLPELSNQTVVPWTTFRGHALGSCRTVGMRHRRNPVALTWLDREREQHERRRLISFKKFCGTLFED